MLAGCCSCCSAFRPRYKKLVDYIFPANPEDGLVKSNMEKLVWYAMHSPDKLDRIGEYLAHRLYRDIHRRKTGYVIIAMDALDQLLVACHANSLNLFVESFLQMIQKLLESQEPMLQLRASQSFEKYANIREETPQYHRRYDFFVSKFASMCYYSDSDRHKQRQLRTAGLMGIQGVVRKTDFDDFGDNIWQPVHMDKIIPALLFNLEVKTNVTQISEEQDVDSADHDEKGPKKPHELSEICLREIICRATLGKIANIVLPLLNHMDHHDLWVKNDFAVQTFKIVMYSIQVQNSVSVIKMLIAHLNEKSSASARWRIGIADVLSKVIPIAAGECIGPSVIDIINSLLEQIRSSIVSEKERGGLGDENSSEKVYRETLIHALGEYANHLPDYQKIETMMFILNKVPGSDQIEDFDKVRPEWEVKLQHLLLKSLLKVGTKYKTVQYSSTFNHNFLIRLMRMSVAIDPEVRLTVQQILHTLIDRQENSSKLAKTTIDFGLLKLNTGKMVRQDVNFWKKSGNEIFLSIQENCEFNNNKLENLDSLYTTMMLIITEIRHDDVVVDTLRVLFHMQNLALEGENCKSELSLFHRVRLMALVGAMMVAVSHCIISLKDHIRAVIDKRSSVAPELLPPLRSHYETLSFSFDAMSSDLLFDLETVLKILKESDFDHRRLTDSVSSMIRRPSVFRQPTTSLSEIHSLSVDFDSTASSPEITRRDLEEAVTFESLKKALSENFENQIKSEEERRLASQAFLAESFETLVAKLQEPSPLHSKLNKLLGCFPPTSFSAAQPFSSGGAIGGLSVVAKEDNFNHVSNATLNLVPPDAPYQLPYPDIIIY